MVRLIKKIFEITGRSALLLLPLIRFPRLNVLFFRMQGYRVDQSARIYSSVQIRGAIDVSIGAHTFIGHETVITGGLASIHVGMHCDISDRVGIVCGTHAIDPLGERSAGQGMGKDIVIEDGVWIGYGAIILPGVKIGRKSVIGAGSVVTKDIPPGSIAAGNPARIIRKLNMEKDQGEL